MLGGHIFSTLNEQIIQELLIDKNPKNLNTTVVDYSSMIMTLIVVYFFRDLDFIWCFIGSVVLFITINRFLIFWYRAYVEVLIIINLDVLEIDSELKAKIISIYGEYKVK